MCLQTTGWLDSLVVRASDLLLKGQEAEQAPDGSEWAGQGSLSCSAVRQCQRTTFSTPLCVCMYVFNMPLVVGDKELMKPRYNRLKTLQNKTMHRPSVHWQLHG